MVIPKIILMDLDGTIYQGPNVIPGALETLDYLKKRNIKVYFFTNNSEKTKIEITDKLNNMGIECKPEDVISSGAVAVEYVKDKRLPGVFVCGSEGFKKEFINTDIELVNEDLAETVVIGMDSSFDYKKLTSAVTAAIHCKTLIACNLDKIFPIDNYHFKPGCGAMVSAIEYCSGKKVDVVIGKPYSTMFNYVTEKTKCNYPNEVLIVGDSFTSDIAMAKNCNCQSVLIGKNQNCNCIDTIQDLIHFLKNVDRKEL